MEPYKIKQKFPDYFPPGCPPADATEREIEVFRLCENKCVAASDFESYFQKNPKRYAGKILAYGISVFPSLAACKSAQDKSPFLRKCQACARGITYNYSGKILNTPGKNNPSHITWWLYEGIEPHTYFELCDTGDGNNDE